MEFKIDKDVPLPLSTNSKHHMLKDVAHSMVPGDSLLLDDKSARICAAFIRRIFDEDNGRSQRKAATRREGDMRRVWRTA